jgi:hypothetical protein
MADREQARSSVPVMPGRALEKMRDGLRDFREDRNALRGAAGTWQEGFRVQAVRGAPIVTRYGQRGDNLPGAAGAAACHGETSERRLQGNRGRTQVTGKERSTAFATEDTENTEKGRDGRDEVTGYR